MLGAAFPQIPARSTMNAALWANGAAAPKADLRIHQYYFSSKSQEMPYILASFPHFVLSSEAKPMDLCIPGNV